MILYCDTSAVIPLVVAEGGTAVAQRLWSSAQAVVSSRLVYAEARAGLSQAQRMGRIDATGLRHAVDDLEALLDDLNLVEVTASVVRRAGELAERVALRGYDALHLSSAETVADAEMVLAAGDRHLLRAAAQNGMATADINAR